MLRRVVAAWSGVGSRHGSLVGHRGVASAAGASKSAEADVVSWLRQIAESRTVYQSGFTRASAKYGVGHGPALRVAAHHIVRDAKLCLFSRGSVIDVKQCLARISAATRVPEVVHLAAARFARVATTDLEFPKIVPEHEVWTNSNDDGIVGVSAFALYRGFNSKKPTDTLATRSRLRLSTIFCPTMPSEAVRTLAQSWVGLDSWETRASLFRLLVAYDTPRAAQQSGIEMGLRRSFTANGGTDGQMSLTYDTDGLTKDGEYHALKQVILPRSNLVLKWHLTIVAEQDATWAATDVQSFRSRYLNAMHDATALSLSKPIK
jgi:hypothetical protein